jgi:hypothetical protein
VRDLVFLLLTVVAFTAFVGLVTLCNRIVGPPEGGLADGAPAEDGRGDGEVDRVVR